MLLKRILLGALFLILLIFVSGCATDATGIYKDSLLVKYERTPAEECKYRGYIDSLYNHNHCVAGILASRKKDILALLK